MPQTGIFICKRCEIPTGIFNNTGNDSSVARLHLFDYGANATVDLTAGNGVYLTGLSLSPACRPSAVQVIYPPILGYHRWFGRCDPRRTTVTLFPSVDQNLNIRPRRAGVW